MLLGRVLLIVQACVWVVAAVRISGSSTALALLVAAAVVIALESIALRRLRRSETPEVGYLVTMVGLVVVGGLLAPILVSTF